MGINSLKKQEVATLCGVSVRTVSNWLLEGFPRNTDGTFDGPACVSWLTGRIEDRVSTVCAPETAESQKWLTAFRRERAKLSKIDRLKAEGSLIDIDRVHEGWALRAYGLCGALEQLADRLPPMLHGKSREEMFTIIGNEIRIMRENLVRAGKFVASFAELKTWILNRET
jgi:hypothetical protein